MCGHVARLWPYYIYDDEIAHRNDDRRYEEQYYSYHGDVNLKYFIVIRKWFYIVLETFWRGSYKESTPGQILKVRS